MNEGGNFCFYKESNNQICEAFIKYMYLEQAIVAIFKCNFIE